MSNFNLVALEGHLGNDPKIFKKGSISVATTDLATNESWKADGVACTRTDWHTVKFFGRLADFVEKYLRKGDRVLIKGKLRKDKWQHKDGGIRYSSYVLVQEIRPLAKVKFVADAETDIEATDAVEFVDETALEQQDDGSGEFC